MERSTSFSTWIGSDGKSRCSTWRICGALFSWIWCAESGFFVFALQPMYEPHTEKVPELGFTPQIWIGTLIDAPLPTGALGSVSWPQSLIFVALLVSHQMRYAMLDVPPEFEMALNGTPSHPFTPLSKCGPGLGRKLQFVESPSP